MNLNAKYFVLLLNLQLKENFSISCNRLESLVKKLPDITSDNSWVYLIIYMGKEYPIEIWNQTICFSILNSTWSLLILDFLHPSLLMHLIKEQTDLRHQKFI